MKPKLILVILLIIGLLITGCVTAEANDNHLSKVWAQGLNDGGMGARIVKYSDPEENIICYVYMDNYRGGISCIHKEWT